MYVYQEKNRQTDRETWPYRHKYNLHFEYVNKGSTVHSTKKYVHRKTDKIQIERDVCIVREGQTDRQLWPYRHTYKRVRYEYVNKGSKHY